MTQDTVIYESPCIKQLIQELRANPFERSVTILHFWDEMKSEGIPFFEPYDDAHFLATFLFEGDENTKTVSLGANFMRRMDEDPQNWFMQHLPDTNIWYWTEKVTRDMRTGYFVTPNHPYYRRTGFTGKKTCLPQSYLLIGSIK